MKALKYRNFGNIYLIIITLSTLVSFFSSNSVLATSTEWKSFSLDSKDVNSISIFKSNDTYGYELVIKINITEIQNGSLELVFEKGDTLQTENYDSVGLFESNITTLSAYLSVYGNNISVSGYYSLDIGKRVSLSPWIDLNLLIILGFFSVSILSGFGLHPLISLFIVVGIFGGLLILSIILIYKSFKSWKINKTNTKLGILSLEVVVFLILTTVVLIPLRFSVF
jgi:hypothetical protein